MDRDLTAERALATRGISDLVRIAHEQHGDAQRRALLGPVRTEARSFVSEALEELADLENYLTWGEQVGEITPEDADDARLHAALARRALTRRRRPPT